MKAKWSRFLSLVGVSVGLLALAHNAMAQEETEEYIYKGKTVSKEYFDAINLSRTAEPLIRSGNLAKAESILGQAVKVASDDADICLNYASVLLRAGKAKEALGYYEKVAVMQPQSEICWVGWSSAYGALGKLNDSLRICNEFLKKFPHSQYRSQMQNQANNIELELKRLAKNGATGSEDANSDNYLREATGGHLQHWSNSAMPLSVHLYPGDKLRNWKPSYNEIMRKAFLDWSESSKGLLSFKFVDDASAGKINCIWTDDAANVSTKGEQGEAHTEINADGEVIKASIKMLTVSPTDPNLALSDDKLRHAALHEVGHALGITGHSTNPDDIMFFAGVSDLAPHLSARDIKTLSILYGASQADPVGALDQSAATPKH